MKFLLLKQKHVVAGVFIVLFGLISFLGFYRYNLRNSTLQFTEYFERQNFQHLASSDIYSITNSIHAVAGTVNWVCIKAQKNNQVFYFNSRGRCESGLFQESILISSPVDHGIVVHFTLKLPEEIENAGIAFVASGFFLLLLIYLMGRYNQRKLLEKDMRIAEIASQVSHDIRSPLAALEMVVSALDHQSSDDSSKMRKMIIVQSVARIRGIVDTILIKKDLNLPQKILPKDSVKQATDQFSVVSLLNVIDTVVSEKNIQFQGSDKISLSIEKQQVDSRFYSNLNPVELSRVISNLINNSIEAAQGDTIQVVLKLGIEDGFNKISVQDNGKGIPTEILNRLGQKGFTFGKEGGTGLGLFHAKKMIESFGGQISFVSSIGKGTEVIILLPIHDAP